MRRRLEMSAVMPAVQVAGLSNPQPAGGEKPQGFHTLGAPRVDARRQQFTTLQTSAAPGSGGARVDRGFSTLTDPSRGGNSSDSVASGGMVRHEATARVPGRENQGPADISGGTAVERRLAAGADPTPQAGSAVGVLERATDPAGPKEGTPHATNSSASESDILPEANELNMDGLMREIARHLDGLGPDEVLDITVPNDRIPQADQRTAQDGATGDTSLDAETNEQRVRSLLPALLSLSKEEMSASGEPVALAVTVGSDGELLVEDAFVEPDGSTSVSASSLIGRLRKGENGDRAEGGSNPGSPPDSGDGRSAGNGRGGGEGGPPPSGPPAVPGGEDGPDWLGAGKDRIVVFAYAPYVPPADETLTPSERLRKRLRERGYTIADSTYRRFYAPLAAEEVDAFEKRKEAVNERKSTKQPMSQRPLPWLSFGGTVGAGLSVEVALEQLPPSAASTGLRVLVYAVEGVTTLIVGWNGFNKNVFKDYEPPLVTITEAGNLALTTAASIGGTDHPALFAGAAAVGAAEFLGMGARLTVRRMGDARAVKRLNRHHAREQAETRITEGTGRKKGVESKRKSEENELAKLRAKHDALLGAWQGGIVTVAQAEEQKLVLDTITADMIRVRRKIARLSRREARRKPPISADKK